MTLPPPTAYTVSTTVHQPMSKCLEHDPVQNISDSSLTVCYLTLVLFYIAGDVSASVTPSKSLLQGVSGKGVWGIEPPKILLVCSCVFTGCSFGSLHREPLYNGIGSLRASKKSSKQKSWVPRRRASNIEVGDLYLFNVCVSVFLECMCVPHMPECLVPMEARTRY